MSFKITNVDPSVGRVATVLYNNNGNHDKIYILTVVETGAFPTSYALKGLYKARTASKFNISTIEESSDAYYLGRTELKKRQEKLDKGYHVVLEKDFEGLGLPPTYGALITALETALNGTQPAKGKGRGAAEAIEFECVDDFNLSGAFLVGCHYKGWKIGNHKLLVEDDAGEKHQVDEDQFSRVAQGA